MLGLMLALETHSSNHLDYILCKTMAKYPKTKLFKFETETRIQCMIILKYVCEITDYKIYYLKF